MITNEGIEWDSDDAANFRAFLETRSGQKVLPKLLEATPGLLPGGQTNDILVRNGEVRGVKIIADAFLSLLGSLVPVPVTEQGNYPSLEDDKQWDDGNKLTPQE